MRKEIITCDGCGKEILGLIYRVERMYVGPMGEERMEFLGLRNPAEYCSLSCIMKGEKEKVIG